MTRQERKRQGITRFLRRLILFCGSLLLLAGAWLCVEAIRAVRAITSQTVASERAITSAAVELPAIADKRLAAIQDQTLELVNVHAKNLEGQLAGAVKITDARLASIEATADRQLGVASGAIATVSQAAASALPAVTASVSHSLDGITLDVHQVTTPAASLVTQFNDTAPLFLDCEYNPDCAFNRFQGTSKAFEKTMQAVAKAAPQTADSFTKIAGHAEKIAGSAEKGADAFTAPKPWWKHCLDYLNAAAAAAAHFL